jgi:hypothetical protein
MRNTQAYGLSLRFSQCPVVNRKTVPDMPALDSISGDGPESCNTPKAKLNDACKTELADSTATLVTSLSDQQIRNRKL